MKSLEKLKIRIKDDLIDDETGKFLFGKGDIIEYYAIMIDKKSGEKNYIVNGYVIPEDIVEVLENEERPTDIV